MSSKGGNLFKAFLFIIGIGIIAGLFFILKTKVSLKAALIVSLILILILATLLTVSHALEKKAKSDRKKNDESASLISQLVSSAGKLSLKASTMNDSFAEEKKVIEKIESQIKSMQMVKDVNASKAEQDILVKLTSVSFSIDGIIAGSDSAEFKKQLAALETAVRQRKLFEN